MSKRSKSARRPTRARTSLAVVAAALVFVAPARARFDETLAAARRAISTPRTADGEQARYDAGRNLEEAVFSLRSPQPSCRVRSALTLAHGLIREAEGYDRPLRALEGSGRRQALAGVGALQGCPRGDHLVRFRRKVGSWSAYPHLRKATPERRLNTARTAALARIGSAFPGWAAIWTQDLVTGETAGWNSDARFPAASTVKLGVLLAALARVPAFSSPLHYDLTAMTRWSSNLAANRVVNRIGGPRAVEAAMRRVGATRSTYPRGYRVGSSLRRLDVEKQPPLVSGRVTTAHDLGRMLYALHAGAFRGAPRSLYGLSLLLGSQPVGNNVGLLRPWLPGVQLAQKNGWLHDARHTAAIVYGATGPKIVVVLTYAPNLRLTVAREVGRRVVVATLR